MGKSLFLDDNRPTPEGWRGVRTAEEAGMRSGVMAAGLLGARTRLGRP